MPNFLRIISAASEFTELLNYVTLANTCYVWASKGTEGAGN